MREARIILPHSQPSHLVHKTVTLIKWLRRELCELAGGYTETMGRGGWVNDEGKTLDEEVTIFDVAVGPLQIPQLRSIAREMGERAEQKCVYLRLPYGEIELIKIEEPSHADQGRSTEPLVAA